ncbi:bifunctional oligoribonuclease/PAP phosphatase NrnA [Planctomycetota bacterium]
MFKNQKQLLIVMQDNPDPDSMASALALRLLAHRIANLACSITHGGTIGRAENRALAHYLKLDFRPIDQLDFSRFDLIALVDTQPGTGNNSLPPEITADIVIDHHPRRRAAGRSKLIDIRRKYGATTTILWEYLRHLNITPDNHLATAMIYGIRSDTHDLGMEASSADIQAIQYLYPLANLRMLSEIQRGRVQREYYQILAHGLSHARIYGPVIITGLGDIQNPDMIGEVADLLLRDDEVQWSLCYGFFRQKMLLSIRSTHADLKADKVMQILVSRRGTGGGHDTLAGGQIPVVKKTKSERTRLEKIIQHKLLHTLGIENNPGEKLVP